MEQGYRYFFTLKDFLMKKYEQMFHGKGFFFFEKCETYAILPKPINFLWHILFPWMFLLLLILLERALRALASSSGGAACPGGTRGQPRGRPQESGGDSKAI